jgi:hypothetical protein
MSEKDPRQPDKNRFWKGAAFLGALIIGAELFID